MSKEWVGLIPAAGKGIRLGLPYPKELYPIIRENRYKPVAQFILENLVMASVKHIVFVINGSKHQLIDYFGDGHRFGCCISYVVQEKRVEHGSTSPGLAHALDAAYHLTRGKMVFLGMADTIMTPEDVYVKLFQTMQAEDSIAYGLFSTEHPEKFGMVHYDSDNRVLEIVDKPSETKLTEMWGCILWRSEFTEHLHKCVIEQGVSDFAVIMNEAIRSGMRGHVHQFEDGSYIDLGTYEEIMYLDQKLREGNIHE